MRIAYLECFSGISGDMFLGALLDAGVPPEVFTRTVEALGVDARLEISRVDRSGISATKLDVIAAGEKELPREEFWEEQSAQKHSALSSQHSARQNLRLGHIRMVTAEEHSHSHAHSHSHDHEHSHGDGESHSHAHEHGHALAFPDTASTSHSHAHRPLARAWPSHT